MINMNDKTMFITCYKTCIKCSEVQKIKTITQIMKVKRLYIHRVVGCKSSTL